MAANCEATDVESHMTMTIWQMQYVQLHSYYMHTRKTYFINNQNVKKCSMWLQYKEEETETLE